MECFYVDDPSLELLVINRYMIYRFMKHGFQEDVI